MDEYVLLNVLQFLVFMSLLIPYKWRWAALLPLSVLGIILCYRMFRD